MRYYVAYKYSRNKNRENLKRKLLAISDFLEGRGDETFILGRDIKKWRHIHFGSIRLIPLIYRHMSRCDILIAYVDSPAFSKGLFFEAIIGIILGKKRIMYLEDETRSKVLKYFFNQVRNISDITQIE